MFGSTCYWHISLYDGSGSLCAFVVVSCAVVRLNCQHDTAMTRAKQHFLQLKCTVPTIFELCSVVSSARRTDEGEGAPAGVHLWVYRQPWKTNVVCDSPENSFNRTFRSSFLISLHKFVCERAVHEEGKARAHALQLVYD